MTKDSWDAAQAEQWLKAAGTATNYSGLYKTVREFKKPTPEQMKGFFGELPEVAKVSGMVDSMVQIDNTWEKLKAIRGAQYRTPKDHPDMQPANEAVILWEHYRGAQRLPDAKNHGAEFLASLKSAEDEAKTAERLLREFAAKETADLRTRLDASFDTMGKSCALCHKAHRN
jgi:hypothetical protein